MSTITIQQYKSNYYLQHKDNWKIYRQNVLQNHKQEYLKYKRDWARNHRKINPEHYRTLYKKNNSFRAFRSFWNRIEKPIILCKVCYSKHYGNGYCKRCYKRIKHAEYYKMNPQKFIEATRKYQINHPKMKKKWEKQYSLTHKKQHNEYARNWNKKNRKRKEATNQRWIIKNRDRYLKRLRIVYGKLRLKYKYLGFETSYPKLNAIWRSLVKHRDKQICQVCGQEGLFAHHLFYQSLYPQLAFNENNGTTLCQKCHNETHGKCLVKISWS